jgi:hypothetical protein
LAGASLFPVRLVIFVVVLLNGSLSRASHLTFIPTQLATSVDEPIVFGRPLNEFFQMNLSLALQPWMRIFLTILVALLLTYTCGRNAQSSAAEALAPTPQFVSITFDDNFGLAAPDAVGGVRAVTEFFAGKHNPTGTGNEAVFDGTPISTTFFKMCVYMVDRSGKVIGGYRGEDWKGLNRSAWKAAFCRR